MRRYGRVALGGTFDRLHVGHEALLATAFRHGRAVAIGLTTEAFLGQHPKPAGAAIAPTSARRRALTRWLRRRYPGRRWTVVPLRDRFGGAVEKGVDALVVSEDTAIGGREVNRERVRRGLVPLPLIVVPLVLADDLQPVSSRRIRAGEIGPHGERRGPIVVGLSVAEGPEQVAATRAIRRAFRGARVVPLRPRTPPGATALTLRRRASAAFARGELGIAVSRGRDGGWRVAVRGAAGTLDPRTVSGRRPEELERGLVGLLHPGRVRPRPRPGA